MNPTEYDYYLIDLVIANKSADPSFLEDPVFMTALKESLAKRGQSDSFNDIINNTLSNKKRRRVKQKLI
jgi:hypothetical protein